MCVALSIGHPVPVMTVQYWETDSASSSASAPHQIVTTSSMTDNLSI